MKAWLTRVKAWLQGRPGMDAELREELEAHLEMEAEDRGLTRDEARRRLGNATRIAESAREAWGFPRLESVMQDVRYAWRAMWRAPGFALMTMLTLGLGIGANTAIFSVVHAVLLKPLPYPAAERLAWLGESTGKAQGISVTWLNYQHWRKANRSFEELAAYQSTELALTGRAEALRTRGMLVTSEYFGLVGMQPAQGRLVAAADDRPGAAAVIVLAEGFWKEKLGGDARIVGSALRLDGRLYEVAGVAAPVWQAVPADFFLPLGRRAGGATDRAQHGSLRVLGRLKPGVTLQAARADLDGIMANLAVTDPGTESDHRSFGRMYAEQVTGDVRGTLLTLLGAAGLVLLIACANAASLLLARNTARAQELAVRTAIGAGRPRLARQLITETALLAGLGGAGGVLLAQWALGGLMALAPAGVPRLAETRLDVPVLLFAVAMTLASVVLAGLAPVATLGRTDLTGALKDGARLPGGSRQKQRLRNALVVAEVALTLVLAFGSGILLRSLVAAQGSGPGFDAKGLLAMDLRLPEASYPNAGARLAFYERLMGELRALPGVSTVAAVYCGPGAGNCGDWFYSIVGRPAPPRNEVPVALFNIAGSGYFKALGIPLRQGREFGERDREGAAPLAVVNETFARQWWPNETALGKQIKFGGPYLEGELLEVVGVVADVKQEGLDSTPQPEVYQPFRQRVSGAMTLLLRTSGNAAGLTGAARQRVAELDANLPVQRAGVLEEMLDGSLQRRRFATRLLALFALLALALAAVGIHGLLSYWVRVREPEIAMRVALGAPTARIVSWTSLHALRLAGIGIGIGLCGAWAGSQVLEDLVYGVAPGNAATLAVAAVAVAGMAALAAAVPSWRAARVDVVRRLQGG